MDEHGFNRIDQSRIPSRGHFLALVGFGLLAVAGGAGAGLLSDRLRPHAPAQLAPAADDDASRASEKRTGV
jgi:hypothetical protein